MTNQPRVTSRLWGLGGLLVAGACVTESLAICVNCNGPFRIVDMRGGYQVILTASGGGGTPCPSLAVVVAPAVSWQGCLGPQGGSVDSTREVITLRFGDSTGATGTLSFFELEGGPDSAIGLWRASCVKQPALDACPSWAGWARWVRDSSPVASARASSGS